MEPLSQSAYQVFLYVLLFVGTAAMGAFTGYIASFLYHERRKELSERSEEDSDGAPD